MNETTALAKEIYKTLDRFFDTFADSDPGRLALREAWARYFGYENDEYHEHQDELIADIRTAIKEWREEA